MAEVSDTTGVAQRTCVGYKKRNHFLIETN
ncbi:MAG: hypothetical protein JWQ09_1903 [Segetibacter sp.]|nr:hypothetical protein [Segetibacter sp.]